MKRTKSEPEYDLTQVEKDILDQVHKANKANRTIEAYLLGWTLIEQFLLPRFINIVSDVFGLNIGKSRIEKMHTSQKILTYLSLSQDNELFQMLDKANSTRNKLFHSMYKEQSWEKINEQVEKAFESEILPVLEEFSHRMNSEKSLPIFIPHILRGYEMKHFWSKSSKKEYDKNVIDPDPKI